MGKKIVENFKKVFKSKDDSASCNEKITKRAYELYEKRGRQEGHAMEDWLQAEQEISKKHPPHNK